MSNKILKYNTIRKDKCAVGQGETMKE